MGKNQNQGAATAGLSRRGFIGFGAVAAAASGTALLAGGGLPAFGVTGGFDPNQGGVGAAATAPGAIPGTTMRAVGSEHFLPYSLSAGATVVFTSGSMPFGVYGSNSDTISAPLDMPVGATLKRVDCYGLRATNGDQSWSVFNLDLPSGGGTGVSLNGTASGSGMVQTSIDVDLPVNAGQRFNVVLFATSANSAAVGAVYQYVEPALGFHPVTPFRAYDSRLSGGPIGSGSRVISVKDARDPGSGVIVTPDAVPAGASAVTFNLTVVNTAATGFLSVVPGDVSVVSSSTINWFGDGEILANASTVKLDGSRQVNVIKGGPGSTNFIIDITGWF